MPRRASRPCRGAGCSAIATVGAYCDAHQSDAKTGTFSDAARGSADARGYGSQWAKIRRRILKRDKGLCQACLALGKYRPAKSVDHIKPKFEGGDDADENLQSLCKPCHDAKTASENRRARGSAEGWGVVKSPGLL